jgi:hypothetical protein
MEDRIKETLWEITHVKLVRMDSGDYCLIVEDTGLNDFVEDHLWDEYEYKTTSVQMNASGIAVYYNALDANLPSAALVEALQQLDPSDVERIYRLNN